jgi:hypothetical protein
VERRNPRAVDGVVERAANADVVEGWAADVEKHVVWRCWGLRWSCSGWCGEVLDGAGR